ncbi:MAG: hypothetical protein ACMUIG_02715 [Thermoplasmatota archaeon]
MIDGDDSIIKETLGSKKGRDDHPISHTSRVVTTTYLIKTGKIEGLRHTMDTRPFALQKAKAVNLSDFSFPTFVITNERQRSSYRKGPDRIKDPSSGSDNTHL